jgi:hypothetical protein
MGTNNDQISGVRLTGDNLLEVSEHDSPLRDKSNPPAMKAVHPFSI